MSSAISISTYLVSLPLEFLRWYFIDATINLFNILRWFLEVCVQILGVTSIFKTYFRPWKNEYREGLVRFSIFMGMFFKTLFLIFDCFLLAFVLIAEIVILLVWVLLPFLVLGGFYAGIFS